MWLLLLLLVILLVGMLLLKPVSTKDVRPEILPALSYQQSLELVDQNIARDPASVAEHGHAILKTHGSRVERSIVLFHGYTNAPRQYELLAQAFFDKGYNVYVPRVPYHGEKDLLTEEISRLKIADLMNTCNQSICIAQGLGKRVSVLGLSMGGVMASWCAQFRDDLDVAVVIVPCFGWYFAPRQITPAIHLVYGLPNMFLWWDPVRKMNRDAPYSMYHRFSTKGMGHIMRLGLAVLKESCKRAPLTKKIVVLTNALDIAVDDQTTDALVKRWRDKGAQVVAFRFSKSMEMEHDVIDPLHPYAKVDMVYEKIFECIDQLSI